MCKPGGSPLKFRGQNNAGAFLTAHQAISKFRVAAKARWNSLGCGSKPKPAGARLGLPARCVFPSWLPYMLQECVELLLKAGGRHSLHRILAKHCWSNVSPSEPSSSNTGIFNLTLCQSSASRDRSCLVVALPSKALQNWQCRVWSALG